MNNYFKNTVTIKQNVENLIANSFFFHSLVDFPFANLPGTHPSNSIPLPPCFICASFVSISTLDYSKKKQTNPPKKYVTIRSHQWEYSRFPPYFGPVSFWFWKRKKLHTHTLLRQLRQQSPFQAPHKRWNHYQKKIN